MSGFGRNGHVHPSPSFAELHRRRRQSRQPGSMRLAERQQKAGKLTARARLECLLDPGSFQEVDAFVQHRETNFGMSEKRHVGDSVITGWGTIGGRLVYVYSQDFTVLGGSVGRVHANKICKVIEMARRTGAPVIGINDSGGARIQEGVVGLGGYGSIFLQNSLASGVIPQISLIMGPCAGGAVYSPALTDFIFMVEETAHMFVTGPDVVEAVTGEQVSFEQLGGATMHNERSGVAHFAAQSEYACLAQVRKLLSYLPANNLESPPTQACAPPESGAIASLLPDSPRKPYDMREIVRSVVDHESFFEIQPDFGRSLLIGLARINGEVVGIVANQPLVLAGVLNVNASRKGARFVRFCDAFNIPLVVFEDVPGFMPGLNEEEAGIIREGAKLLYAFCEATVPKITVIVRKAYGGAYLTMNCKEIRSDLNVAWPSAEIAVMGPDGAVNIIFRRELAAADDPIQRKTELVQAYRAQFANPFVAAENGYLDDVITPEETRDFLISGLHALRNKRIENPARKHSTMPL